MATMAGRRKKLSARKGVKRAGLFSQNIDYDYQEQVAVCIKSYHDRSGQRAALAGDPGPELSLTQTPRLSVPPHVVDTALGRSCYLLPYKSEKVGRRCAFQSTTHTLNTMYLENETLCLSLTQIHRLRLCVCPSISQAVNQIKTIVKAYVNDRSLARHITTKDSSLDPVCEHKDAVAG